MSNKMPKSKTYKYGEFPDWAPPELVKIHESLKRDHQDETSISPFVNSPEYRHQDYLKPREDMWLLELLCTHRVMEKTWRNLGQHRSTFRAADEEDIPEISLVSQCRKILANWLTIPKRTATESVRRYERVIKGCFELSEALSDCESVTELALRHIDIHDEVFADFLESAERVLRLPEKTLTSHADTLSFIYPSTSVQRVLHSVIAESKQLRDRPPGVAQPNSPRAGLRFFIRNLTEYFESHYGQPLDQTVANVASVLFQTDVDKDNDVRALRNEKRRRNVSSVKKAMERLKADPDLPLSDVVRDI